MKKALYLYDLRLRKAAKDHVCILTGIVIKKGELYHSVELSNGSIVRFSQGQTPEFMIEFTKKELNCKLVAREHEPIHAVKTITNFNKTSAENVCNGYYPPMNQRLHDQEDNYQDYND